jgi:integrase
MKHRTYIIRSKKPYQQFLFRCIIPHDLKSYLGQNEFRVSLGNSLYSHSKIIATNLYNLCQFIFREVREGYMKNITLEDVKNILRIEVKKSLMHIHHYEYGTNKYVDKKLNEGISRIDDEEQKLRGRLEKDYKGTIDLIENEIDKILITQNLEPNKDNVEYKGLVRRWIDLKLIRQNWKRDLLNGSVKTDDDFQKEIEKTWKLDVGNISEHKTPPPVIENYAPEPIEPYITETNTTKRSNTESPLLSKVIPEFLERMKINHRRNATISASKETLKQVIQILGDKGISDYTNVDGRDYRNSLSKLPANRKKSPKYRDISLKYILSMDIPMKDRTSPTTQKHTLSRISGLWNYLIDNYPEFVRDNVFITKSQQSSSIKLKDRKESFTEKDLKVIFDKDSYLNSIFGNTFTTIQYPYFFIPILGCFTGARLEELCMMRVKDIVKVDSIWVYRIREEGEYGNEETLVKNSYSERDIPLHSVLVDTLGFIKYVNHIKKMNKERVFWELPKVGNKYQKNVGRFFNTKYLKKVGIKDGIRKVSFHSFRHSVETHLTNHNINPRFIDYLQGHSSKDTGGNIYMKGIKPEVLLRECVSKIDYGIDWNELKIKW